ncbi:uncharacterized protein LOC129577863 [Sitodiplosis mosellana]|uniref:uncharacterized protein LOC129577863 n=1 Tax=Sitodiplosis mosellana TaxID=263140 RepID=UPI002444800F|nr:uncharacterized protein LOC129577863 [Sitodiplosis mosellana]
MNSNCPIALCVLLNLILLCHGLNTGRYKRYNVARNGNNVGLGIGFPESEEQNPDTQHKLHKQPVQFPSKCKDGELYYPGDQGDDWVCDCKPGYVFYPPSSQCFAAFKRGPCNAGNYLVLPKSSVIPECVRNPCVHDNFVSFRGNCYQLDKSGPCPVPELMNVIGVNETTLEIICTLGYTANEVFNTATRFGGSTEKPSNQSTPSDNNSTTPAPEVIFYYRKECFKGGKRWKEEKCPQQNEQKNIDDIFGKLFE